MKDEIYTLIDVASSSIAELENYLFKNLKEKYIISKNILDDHKKHVENIRGILEYDLTTEEIEMAKSDLNLIIDTIKNSSNGLSYESLESSEEALESVPVNNVQETENSELEFSEEDIDALLKALDENEFETVFPKEDINPEPIETSINSLENEVKVENPTPTLNAQVDYSQDLDINAIDAFLNTDNTSDSQDAFRL